MKQDRGLLLRRTRNTAAINGGSIASVAGLFAMLSIALGNWQGGFIGLAFATTGGMELRGRSLLASNARAAGHWLLGAQAAFFGLIVVYSAYQLLTLTGAAIIEAMPPGMLALLKQRLQAQTGIEFPDEVLGETLLYLMLIVYIALIAVSFIYQGFMAWYYRRRLRQLIALETQA